MSGRHIVVVNTVCTWPFMLFNLDGTPNTTAVDGDFTKYLAHGTTVSGITVTVSKVSAGGFPGLFVAQFTPNTLETWVNRVVHPTLAPRGFVEEVDSIADLGTTLSPTVLAQIADTIMRRQNANVEASADGDALDFQSLYGAIAKLTNGFENLAGLLKVYKADKTHVLGTQNAQGSPGAAPITGLSTN